VGVAVFCCALAPRSAEAQGADDHAVADALVKQLEADGTHRAVTADALARAKAALERATRLRGAGDEGHAKAADGLAREWAETGRDLARAADAEATAAELRHKAVEAQAQLERTRTMVEEGITRVGRLKAELEEAERSGAGRSAVEAHEGDPPPPKPAKKTKPTAAAKPPAKPAPGGAP
jgi:hypothetical protein